MEQNKLNQGELVSVHFASSEDSQQSLSNCNRVSFSTNADEKEPLLDHTAAGSFWRGKSDDSARTRSAAAASYCAEAGCARNCNSENGFIGSRCRCWQHRRKRRRFMFHAFALLAVAGLFAWYLVPKYFGCSAWNTAPHVHFSPDAHKGEYDHLRCDKQTVFAKTFKFEDLKTFTLRNLIETKRRHDHFRNSFVQVLPAEDQKEDVVIDFSFKTSDAQLQKLLDIKQTDDSLIIEYPTEKLHPEPGYSACIETQTKIYVRSGLKLKYLEIESRILGITIPSAIDMWVDSAKLVCLVGELEANPLFNARETIIRVVTGSISGSFPLYDILDVETHTGSTKMDILPRPANNADVQPAKLIANTKTGSMLIEYKVEDELPDRDYQVRAASMAGRIVGFFIHGTSTQLESTMGSISATILPYTADRYESDVTTITRSGKQSITVLSPYRDAQKPLARLEATHKTVTGAVDVHYPNSWEGTVEAVANLGSVSVSGPDLRIIKESKGVTGRFVEAKKGDGDGTTLCRAETGSVRFTVNEA